VITAPEVSFTVPEIVPVVTWAPATAVNSNTHKVPASICFVIKDSPAERFAFQPLSDYLIDFITAQ